MRKGVIAGVALGLAGGMGAYAGYEVAEAVNSEPVEELDQAYYDLDQNVLGYLGLAEIETCEQNVLSTMYNINAVNTPKDEALTAAALDNVCGPANGNYHIDLAEKSSEIFVQIQSDKSRIARLEDTTVFDLNDKESGIAIGLVLGLVGAVSVAAALNTERVSRVIRKRQSETPSEPTRQSPPRKSSEPEGKRMAREAYLSKSSRRN